MYLCSSYKEKVRKKKITEWAQLERTHQDHGVQAQKNPNPVPESFVWMLLKILFSVQPPCGEDFCDFPPQPSPAQLPPISYIYLYIFLYINIYI